MDINTTTAGQDDDNNTSNSVENINGYNVFTDEYYENVDRVTLLENNKVTNFVEAVYKGECIDDTEDSYMLVMQSVQGNVVRNDYGKQTAAGELNPIIWGLIGAGLTLIVILAFNVIKNYLKGKKS